MTPAIQSRHERRQAWPLRQYQLQDVDATIRFEESRNPAQHVVNVRAARSFQMRGRRLELSFQVFNLFNANTATDIRYVSGPTYHAISEILPPRVARFGAEFSF